MATNKTLAPTNVTIAIPAMADKPDASVFSNCVDKEADAINALNSNMDNVINANVLTDLNYVPPKINLIYMKRYSNSTLNVPDASSGMVFTLKIASDGSSVIQFAVSYSLKIYTRRRSSGTWGEWVEK